MHDRVRVPELMDDPALDAAAHDRALAGLMRLNAWSRSHRLLWRGVAAHARDVNAAGRALRVVDVATGAGDAPIAMAAWARREGLRIEWVLCDRSAHALGIAAAAARAAGVAATTVEADAVAAPLPCEGDVVTCSLFLHHCDPADAARVLAHMAGAATRGVGVTDLDRTRGGLALAWLGSRVLSRSRIVHHDASASVRAAFTREEIAAIARDAGLPDAEVRAAWPARWTLWWRRA
jgi:2-polyprenyl-3-methyl-5-hydroxy-6-metoxy-1,4-benzoquinol methylase